ncbi:MAG: ROK family protein [Streptosporangiaceae bacterium]
MAHSAGSVIVGLDNGGTMNNATVLDSGGRFLVGQLLELPSRVREGPDPAIAALAASFEQVLDVTGLGRAEVRAVGLDTPGPASADGVLSSRGGTNFGHSGWAGFNIRAALEDQLGLPVVYTNDANAAALYAHYRRFGRAAAEHSSVAAIVGTGLGGGLVESGRVVSGAAGMAGELGHVQIPLDGLLAAGQPVPSCNCGLTGDAESIASLTGIERNLLPFWLTQFPGHELAAVQPVAKAARLVRGFGAAGDPLARRIFEQQAMALGRTFSLAAMFTDPGTYFVGGGVVEAGPAFSQWFLGQVQAHTTLREEQRRVVEFALVPDLDMAGARGAALAARSAVAGPA